MIDDTADRKLGAEPFYEVTAQKKAKTTAALTRGSVGGSALVQFEQVGNLIWGHTDARIGNFDFNKIAMPTRRDCDRPAGQSELDRITHEIAQHRCKHVTMRTHLDARAIDKERYAL